jgi:hypothetical protein
VGRVDGGCGHRRRHHGFTSTAYVCDGESRGIAEEFAGTVEQEADGVTTLVRGGPMNGDGGAGLALSSEPRWGGPQTQLRDVSTRVAVDRESSYD